MYPQVVARPRSDDKRSAILNAATHTIVAQGLGVPTATIAHHAGIANGSLFTYFETKAVLFNQLYVFLKSDMAQTALADLVDNVGLREQFSQVWSSWTRWAVQHPERHRALALLSVSDGITPESRNAGHQAMTRIAVLVERSRMAGPLRDAPVAFVGALMESLAETTMDFMVRDPDRADAYRQAGFDALWRLLT